MQAVFITPESWHYKLQEFVYGKVPYRIHFCPYFWLTIAAMFFFPVILAFRGVLALFRLAAVAIDGIFGPAYRAYDKRSIERSRARKEARLVTAREWMRENITSHYEAFRFYHMFVHSHRREWYFKHVPEPKEKEQKFYKLVWEEYQSSEEKEKEPFDLEDFHYYGDGDSWKVYKDYTERLNAYYDEFYCEPLRQNIARKAELEEMREQRAAAQKEMYAKLATYTRYPAYALLTVLTLLVGGIACFGLYKIFLVASASWMVTLKAVGEVLAVLSIIALFVMIGIGVLSEESEFEDFPLLMRITTTPFRFFARSMVGKFCIGVVKPGAEKALSLLKAGLAKLKSILSIFGSFAHSMYEGSCPNMIIDGDNPNDNHRIDNL